MLSVRCWRKNASYCDIGLRLAQYTVRSVNMQFTDSFRLVSHAYGGRASSSRVYFVKIGQYTAQPWYIVIPLTSLKRHNRRLSVLPSYTSPELFRLKPGLIGCLERTSKISVQKRIVVRYPLVVFHGQFLYVRTTSPPFFQMCGAHRIGRLSEIQGNHKYTLHKIRSIRGRIGVWTNVSRGPCVVRS